MTDQQVIELLQQVSTSGDGESADFFTDALHKFKFFQPVQGLDFLEKV
ncbi:hypothetical protein HMPREF9374_0494 [Desmospora sp. 8437]|nr:hypothetical protein HMPREF9374_0494 [Desmospora sp. 8437]